MLQKYIQKYIPEEIFPGHKHVIKSIQMRWVKTVIHIYTRVNMELFLICPIITKHILI